MRLPDSFTEGSTDSTEYTVCGLVLLSKSEDYQQLYARLQTIDGLDIYNSSDNGRFAVTLEELPGGCRITDQIEVVRNLPGVVDLSLAYSHTEPISDVLAADSHS
ncbi:chaperone NapD [Endozoicomonas sp. OPT23]|uniref:chaperone NapD n=1 Tax=Endozoicomonas sp. OPT23 TaxID=2072845 RepID=UPI0018918086|nr:chaperone NapD [Endozoicomonas sp. OPT23]